MQFDWAEFTYEQDGVKRKFHGFAAILCYSRMRFVTFVKHRGTPMLLRCFMEACEYFGGLPKAASTDLMKSVLLTMDGKVPRCNPFFLDFMASYGVAPRVCKASTPQTTWKIERLLCELADLSFIQRTSSVFFLRLPGNGKTHLAIALSVKALADER